MDNKLLQKTRDKLKHDLSSEEQEALRKCSATINTHTRIGSILGGGLSVYGMYRRKLWPLSKYWGRGLFFGIGGIVVGMQIGLVTASIQCVKIVKALPNPDHVMKALREVQVELQDARRRPLGEQREWSQKSENDPTPREEASFGQETMREDSEQRQTMSSWDSSPYQNPQTGENGQPYNGPGPAPTTPDARNRGSVGSSGSSNVWQQIRGETGRAETAWERLRKTGSSAEAKPQASSSPFGEEASSDASTSAPAVDDSKDQDRMRQQSEFDSLLERERRGEAEDSSRRRNRFGDYE